MHIMFDLEGATPTTTNVNGKSKIKPFRELWGKITFYRFFRIEAVVVWSFRLCIKALNQLIWDTRLG